MKVIDRIIIVTLILAACVLSAGPFFNKTWEGVALFCGALWGACNLFFLKNLLKKGLIEKQFDPKFFLLLAAKGPLIYGSGYLLLKNRYLPSFYLLAGFSLLCAVVVIVSLKELIFKKYEAGSS